MYGLLLSKPAASTNGTTTAVGDPTWQFAGWRI